MLKNKRFRKVIIISLIISLTVALITIRPTSADSVFSLTEASYELNREDPGRITVSMKVPYTGTYVSFQGRWSESEVTATGGEAETEYFTLVSHELAKNEEFKQSWQESYYYLEEDDDENEEPDYAYWVAKDTNSNAKGLKYTAGDTIWTATYEIDEDTPAGDYYVGFRGLNTTIYDNDNVKTAINNEWDQYIVAKVTVTRTKAAITPKITLSEASYTYTGSQITPAITVTDEGETVTLEENTDYTVSYGHNTTVAEGGSVTINPVATSDYTFEETTKNFTIDKALSEIDFTDPSLAQFASLLRQHVGTKLSEILLPPIIGNCISWSNSNQTVEKGYTGYFQGLYAATYQNPDTANYYPNPDVNVPIYGLSQINITTSVDGEHGAISDSLENVWEDTPVTITFTPDFGYSVDVVTVNGTPVNVTGNTYQFVAGPNNTTIVATFKDARTDLVIGGQDDNQSIPYTGEAVQLRGSLHVGENDDDVTVDDLTTTWYDCSGAEDVLLDEAPVNAGTYKAVYSYNGENYKGYLVVNFTITKIDSVLSEQITAMIGEYVPAEAGYSLNYSLPIAFYANTIGDAAAWVDGNTIIETGLHYYPATYLTKNDAVNYNPITVYVPVYGLSRINITTSVNDESFGTISESLTNVLEGSEVTITLTPENGYKVKKVLVNGEKATVSENKVVFNAEPTDMTVVATFCEVQEDLLLTGISSEDNQNIVYTGQPVQLVGSLAIGLEDAELTVDDIGEPTWYDAEEQVLDARPVSVGTYKAVYSYNETDYKGTLEVNLKIVPAQSVVPEGIIESLDIKLPVGTPLSEINIATYGAAWVNSDATIEKGENKYQALYVTNGDVINYLPTQVEIPIYGLSFISIAPSVNGENGEIELVTEGIDLNNVLEGTEVKFALTPEDDYQIKEVLVNGQATTILSNTVTVTAIAEDMTVVATFERIPFEYEYLEGKGQTVDLNSQESAKFRIDADYELLDKVYVDDIEINAETKSGSTVVILAKEFLETLSEGTHTLKVTFKDNGVAATTFTVKAKEAVEPTDEDTKEDEEPKETVVIDDTTDKDTSSTPKTGDKVLMDIYIAIVSGLGVFMIIDHKLNSKPRKSVRRKK